MFFTGFIVSMVTDYVKIIDKTYLAITHLLNDTMLLSIGVRGWFNDYDGGSKLLKT